MKRSVAQIGPSTLMISLPSKWVKKFGIKKGDELEVEERDSSLAISIKRAIGKNRIRVDVSGLNERVIRWLLSGIHKSGYDEIEVVYEEPRVIRVIQDLIKELYMGFIIAEQTERKCLLKNVSTELEKEFNMILRRAFLVTISIGETSLNALLKGKFSELKEISALEHSNNQFTNFCERVINKGVYSDYKKAPFIYVVAWGLEKVCDEYKYICEELYKEKNFKLSNEVVNIFKEANEFFKRFYEIFYNFKLEEFNDLVDSKSRILEKIKKMYPRDERESVLLHHLMEIVVKTVDLCPSTIAINLEDRERTVEMHE